MPRKPKRDTWRLLDGRWTRSLGHRGARCRLFEIRRGGPFYRDVWIPGRGKNRKCLYTTDRAGAERLGTELLAAILRNEEVTANGTVGLRYLWDRYRKEAPGVLDNAPRTQQEDAAQMNVLIAFFGDNCDVRLLAESDVQAFIAARMRGGIQLPNGEITKPVRARSADAALQVARTMLRWATTVRVRGGQRLLAANPLAGVRGAREKNPKRPLASWDRFQATRQAMRELAETSGDPARCQHWLRIELALVLAESTGRRLGAIRQLRWEDFDFANGKVNWRADADKMGRDWTVPLPAELLEEVKRFRVKLGGAFGGFLFPSRADPEKALDRHAFQKALVAAEKHAGLPKLDGSA